MFFSGVGARSYNQPAPAAARAPSLLAASARAAPRGALTLLLLAAAALLLLVLLPPALALLRRHAERGFGQLFINRFPEWPLHKEKCATARARASAAAAAAAAERAAVNGRPSRGRRLVARVARFAAARPPTAEDGPASEEPGEVLEGPPRDRISASGLRRVGRVQRAAARAAAAAAAEDA